MPGIGAAGLPQGKTKQRKSKPPASTRWDLKAARAVGALSPPATDGGPLQLDLDLVELAGFNADGLPARSHRKLPLIDGLTRPRRHLVPRLESLIPPPPRTLRHFLSPIRASQGHG